ncbi:sugar kinase [Vibrio tapetis subsp. quintayensis]|uniref:sugar kinase n=1 Tax=Vibrio tapetis TaxID=52443 RepID=UPI0025B3BBA7|nr:sugar kinase [Vibrio tapetis]MDN3681766.1 sugar kinase [Vibrio tapetis subsp. quintayensis]
MTTFKIAVLGECMVELQKKGDLIKRTFGGDTLNTALYLSRLTQDQNLATSYVTALGNDPFSQDMLASWQEAGVDTSLVGKVDGKQPGLYYIETDETGERSFFYWRNDAAAKFVFDQPETPALIEKLFEFDALYLSGISLAILTKNGKEVLFNFLEQYRERGGKVIFDNNYRPKLWDCRRDAIETYTKMLGFTDTALLTFDDEQELYGDLYIEQCIERTTEAGVKEIVIKRGSKDCLVIEDGKGEYVPPTLVSNVVDTTAAGDSFSAGYLAKRLCGGTPIQSAAAGHIVAGAVIQHQGAIIPADAMPTLDL